MTNHSFCLCTSALGFLYMFFCGKSSHARFIKHLPREPVLLYLPYKKQRKEPA